jgi:Fe-S-cluster containining protein
MQTAVQDEPMVQLAAWEEALAGQPDPDIASLEQDLVAGLRFGHVMMSINRFESREAAIRARALAELLVRKGLLDQEELDTMAAQVRQEVEALPAPKVLVAKSGDKYACEQSALLDCASRLPICKARCCTFDFYLSEQDLDEGIVRWDYGRPYWIRQRPDGYCVHCDPETYRCRIHGCRPAVCRLYDCRNDGRVWADFEQKAPSAR